MMYYCGIVYYNVLNAKKSIYFVRRKVFSYIICFKFKKKCYNILYCMHVLGIQVVSLLQRLSEK